MLLSIIVTNYKTTEILKLCLKSFRQNLEGPDQEIIVADAETDPEAKMEIEDSFPEVIFLETKENAGFGAVVNRGLKIAKGDYIFIANSDIVINRREDIQKMIDYLAQNKNVGLLGPALLNVNGSRQNSCFRFYTPLIILLRRSFLDKTDFGKKILGRFSMEEEMKKNNGQPIEVDWLMGSALLTKKELATKVGLFDERFFMYFEDVDWCRRFWEAGYKVIYFPQAQLYHYHIQASKKGLGLFDVFISKYTRIHLASAVKYFLKYGLKTPRYGAR